MIARTCDHCQRETETFAFNDRLYAKQELQLCDDPPFYCWSAADMHEQQMVMDEVYGQEIWEAEYSER